MDKLTIKDIAGMAGVSQTAVSFVLNGKSGVSEKTRAKISDVIEKTGFRPSINSRRLFFQKSYTVTLAVRKTSSPFDNLFYFEIAKGLLEKSKVFRYNVVFADIHIEDDGIMLPDIIKFKDTDGVVFLQDTENAVLDELNKLKIPFVIIDAHKQASGMTTIYADYELSSYTAVKYLAGHGHRSIALIGSSFIPEFYLQCFSGYKRVLDEIGQSIPPAWMQIDATDEVTAYQRMEKILRQANRPTAVFCASDMFAIGAMKCVKDHGLQVPGDISFIAIDDILLSRYCEPKLTTIRIDKEKMGQLAMDLIIAKINGETVQSAAVESDHIIERDTVRLLENEAQRQV
jgi:LacI family transcriptional regulator